MPDNCSIVGGKTEVEDLSAAGQLWSGSEQKPSGHETRGQGGAGGEDKSSGRVMKRISLRINEQRLQQQLCSESGRVHSGIINQPLDHFNPHTDSFPQRFYVNDAFWLRPHGPVFLYVGGEGALSEFSVLAGHHVSLAQDVGALLLSLEHRFYGKSVGESGLSMNTLRFLSSQQALADVVEFHAYISERFGLSHRNSWISFGGSYAGALSAWLRGQFPHLFYGSVASSAPVRAQLDFSFYNKVVAASLADDFVGGSEECVSAVREAFSAVEVLLLRGNLSRLCGDFFCCSTLETPDDGVELVKSLADIVMATVQYNEEGGPLTIAQLCLVLTNQSGGVEPYRRLVRLASVYVTTEALPCLPSSHRQLVQELRSLSPAPESFGMRQWLYQTCNEFGFYETCEDSTCPFSRVMSLQSDTRLCPLVFDIPEDVLPSRMHFTNQYYGAKQPHTHRVLYVNGDIDPWHVLSVLPCHSASSIFIRGGAHCADMNPDRRTDTPALRAARLELQRRVKGWLMNATRGQL